MTLLQLRQKILQKRIKDWETEKVLLMAEQDLKEDIQNTKNRKKPPKQQRKALTTSKFLMLFLFISCSAIEVFTMYAILKGMNMGFGIDFTPLTMLITSIVAEVIGFSVYSLKSMKENTKGGIVYETALFDKMNNTVDQSCSFTQNNNEQEIMG